MRIKTASIFAILVLSLPAGAFARGSGADSRNQALSAAVTQWLRAPYALALPEALRPSWSAARFSFNQDDPARSACAALEGSSNVVRVNLRCMSDADSAMLESGRALVSSTRMQWELYYAAVSLWARTSPVARSAELRDEIVAERFFDANRSLGVNVDQAPALALLDFWAKSTYSQLVFPRGAHARPRLFRFLARVFFTDAETAAFDKPADLEARAERDRYALNARARLLVDSAEAWFARYRLIKAAKKSIHSGYFTVWKSDVFGRAFLGMLLQKQKQGVKVKLVVDGRGYWHTRDDYLQELVEAGAEVRVYNPILNKNFSLLGTLVAYHDKILLVDDKYFVTGGRNIGDRYFIQADEAPGRVYWDTDVALELDRVPVELHFAFNREFHAPVSKPVPGELLGNWSSKEDEMNRAIRAIEDRMHNERLSPETMRHHPELANYTSLYGIRDFVLFKDDVRHPIEILDNTARFGSQDELTRRIFQLIDGAREEVLVQNPYLVLTPEAKLRLANAAKRGVKVRFSVTTPMSTDSYLTQSVLSFEWKKIAADIPGCEINGAVGPAQLHAKIFVIDGDKAIVGSYNMDSMSQNRNSELSVLFKSRPFAQQVWAGVEEHITERSVRFDAATGAGPEQIEGSEERIEMLEFYYGLAKWFRPLL